jgi:hypothetical protein
MWDKTNDFARPNESKWPTTFRPIRGGERSLKNSLQKTNKTTSGQYYKQFYSRNLQLHQNKLVRMTADWFVTMQKMKTPAYFATS